MLDKVIEEAKLASTGLVDPATAARIGELAGVDGVVTGTLVDMQSSVAVNCRVIDVTTARVFGVADSRIVKDDDLRVLMGQPMTTRGPQPVSGGISPPPAEPDAQTASADGFSFMLQSCRRGATSSTSPPSGSVSYRPYGGTDAGTDTVVCRLTITNQRDDRNLYVFGYGARAFDESGQEFQVSNVTVADSRGRTVSKTLVSELPTPASMSFEGVPVGSVMFSSLEIGFNSGSAPPKFRRVPIR
jgi:hypothetical protein